MPSEPTSLSSSTQNSVLAALSIPLRFALSRSQILAGIMAAAIFAADAFTRTDLAVAGLYVLVLLVGTSGATNDRRQSIAIWSVICTVLSLTGYAIFLTRGAPPLAMVHLVISLVVVLVTSWLLLRSQSKDTAAAASESRYRRVFDTLAVAIVEHDFTPVAEVVQKLRRDGVDDIRRYVAEHPEFVIEMRRLVAITDVNATALRMMGVHTKEQFTPRLDGFLPETDDSFADCIVAIDERRDLFQHETVVETPTGDPRHVVAAFSLGPEANLHCVPGILLDLGHLRSLEAQILRAKEELAEVQRTSALAAMSASIAHEINQPMAAIHSFADAAKNFLSRPTPDVREATASLTGLLQAVGHARTVMHRVRSLVGSARIEKGEVELGSLMETTAAVLRRDATDAGARIYVEIPKHPLFVNGDRILLKQVLVNLVTNAMQAMTDVPRGLRVVTITLEDDYDEAVIRVADRGHGWDEAERDRVFGSFYTTKRSGMGLGLSITRTAVERHGGTILLAERDGGGAVVEVVLPLVASLHAESDLERGAELLTGNRLLQ